MSPNRNYNKEPDSSILSALAHDLAQLNDRRLLRELRKIKRIDSVKARVDGRDAILFCSNDYLALAADKRIVEALYEGSRLYGAGAGASRLISGSLDVHRQAEEHFAKWKGVEDTLLFGSGYLANLGVISALLGRGDVIFCDRINHASIIDGSRLSGARFLVYNHCDVEGLSALLEDRRKQFRRALIVTDSVFSMDGDVAPLNDLLSIAEKHDALLLVDEAHGTGVLGAGGRGALEVQGVSADHPNLIAMSTLSKALGVYGAFVGASSMLIQYLVNHARSFIYSTALPPAIAHAVPTILEIIRDEPWRREKIIKLSADLYRRLIDRGWQVNFNETPIIPIMLGDEGKTLQIQDRLLEAGFFVPAIRPPSVPRDTCRLRLTLSAAHSDEHLAQLVDALGIP